MSNPKLFRVFSDDDTGKRTYIWFDVIEEVRKFLENQFNIKAKPNDLCEITDRQEIFEALQSNPLNQKLPVCTDDDSPGVCPCNKQEDKYCWKS